MDKTIYCPLYKDIKLAPCPRPPAKSDLLNYLAEYS